MNYSISDNKFLIIRKQELDHFLKVNPFSQEEQNKVKEIKQYYTNAKEPVTIIKKQGQTGHRRQEYQPQRNFWRRESQLRKKKYRQRIKKILEKIKKRRKLRNSLLF